MLPLISLHLSLLLPFHVPLPTFPLPCPDAQWLLNKLGAAALTLDDWITFNSLNWVRKSIWLICSCPPSACKTCLRQRGTPKYYITTSVYCLHNLTKSSAILFPSAKQLILTHYHLAVELIALCFPVWWITLWWLMDVGSNLHPYRISLYPSSLTTPAYIVS